MNSRSVCPHVNTDPSDATPGYATLATMRACGWLARRVATGSLAGLAANGVQVQLWSARWREAPAGLVRDCQVAYGMVVREAVVHVRETNLWGQAGRAGSGGTFRVERLRKIEKQLLATGVDATVVSGKGNARQRGRSLGRALGRLADCGVGAGELVAVAKVALTNEARDGWLMEALAGSLGAAKTAPHAALGGLACLGKWAQAPADGPIPPQVVAWLDAGLGLRVPNDMLVHVRQGGAWMGDERSTLLARLATSIAGWNTREVAVFEKAVRIAQHKAEAFNTLFPLGDQRAADFADKTVAMVQAGVEASLVARRLAAGQVRVRVPRRRA